MVVGLGNALKIFFIKVLKYIATVRVCEILQFQYKVSKIIEKAFVL